MGGLGGFGDVGGWGYGLCLGLCLLACMILDVHFVCFFIIS